MPVGRCPHCFNRFAYDELDDDYVHTCHGSNTLSQEDRPITEQTPNYNLQGLANKRGGNLVNVPGEPKSYDYTPRGNREVTHFQRQYYQHIDLTGE
mgnify:CR=1 FL=1